MTPRPSGDPGLLADLWRARGRQWPGRPRAKPFEFMTLSYLLVGGLATLLHVGQPSSIEALVSPSFMVWWSVMLTVGAGTALVGLLWRQRYTTSLYLEQIGLILVGGASVAYAIALTSIGLNRAVIATAFVLGFGTAAFWRVGQIVKDLRLVARTIERNGNGGGNGG